MIPSNLKGIKYTSWWSNYIYAVHLHIMVVISILWDSYVYITFNLHHDIPFHEGSRIVSLCFRKLQHLQSYWTVIQRDILSYIGLYHLAILFLQLDIPLSSMNWWGYIWWAKIDCLRWTNPHRIEVLLMTRLLVHMSNKVYVVMPTCNNYKHSIPNTVLFNVFMHIIHEDI